MKSAASAVSVLAQKAVLAADQGLAPAGIDQKASLLATKLANVCLSHTECVCGRPGGKVDTPFPWPTRCAWATLTGADPEQEKSRNSCFGQLSQGSGKNSFANRGFCPSGRPFSWVGRARAVGFGSSGLLGWPAAWPDGRQLRRQAKRHFQGVLEAAGRKKLYANGEPLSPHL